ncbi:type I-E CRISPR-associated protein Cas6/Cse3/CasE [Psychrobacter jeotgali]|uniref:type I-E CRISPR-associated protein Cas6/Cse3/CasE n=1 Tax=Psychrobacter jeotgali TaxID=179010 RepID=UPI001919ECF0|nr:type I-E CRISPR-associated protein Cas6/Cse3/CasE [Psychrobacter jeotgali]
MNYLSKVTLKPSMHAKHLFVKEQINPQRPSSMGNDTPKTDNPYRVHQALWQLFDLPPGSDRPFLYREYERGGETFYYVLSTIKPNLDHLFFNVHAKVFNPKFFAGQRLAFELRANPVSSLKDAQGKSSRHDVLMLAKKSMISQGFDDSYSIDQAMFDAGVDWITSQERMQAWGVVIHPNLELSAYTQHRLRRSKQDLEQQKQADDTTDKKPTKAKKKMIQFSSLDYAGALEIQDVDLFYNQMIKGFGKQKAFGCGLMLVRPLRQNNQ